MSFNANVLQVLIASPGDTMEARDAVEGALHGWNASRSEREQVILLPRRWETDAVPTMGSSGQETINAQLVVSWPDEPIVGTDRKSTRLNSSHVSSSYAVFCLKKKKDDSKMSSGGAA